MSVNSPDIPSLSSKTPTEIRRAFDSIKSWFASVKNSGGLLTNVDLSSGAIIDSVLGNTPYGNTSVPPKPTGLVATGGFNSIFLGWNWPHIANLAYTEIWRSGTDVLADAVKVGATSANLYADTPPDASLSVTYYYWVRFISTANITGPYSDGVSGSTANDPAYILEILTDQIRSSQLHTDLSSRINLIDMDNTGLIATLDHIGESLTGLVVADADRWAELAEHRQFFDAVVEVNPSTGEITLKATAEIATDVEARITGLETEYSAQSATINTTVNTVSAHSNSISSYLTGQNSTITQLAGQITQKAESSYVDISVEGVREEANRAGIDSNNSLPEALLYLILHNEDARVKLRSADAHIAVAQQDIITNSGALSAESEARLALASQVDDNRTYLVNNYYTRTSIDSASAGWITAAVSQSDDNRNTALANYYTKTETDTSSSLAESVQLLQADLGENGATYISIQTAYNKGQAGVDDAQDAQDAADAAQRDATSAKTELDNVVADNILAKTEKPGIIRQYNLILSEQTNIDNQANDFIADGNGISGKKADYDNAVTALTTYLGTLTAPVAWNNLTDKTTIVGTTFDAKFSDVYDKRQLLLNAIAVVAKGLADDAQETADSKIKTFVGDHDTVVGMITGDLCVDNTEGNKLYRYSGTAWVAYQDLNKSTTFVAVTAAPPTAGAVGDLWVVSDADNRIKRWDGDSWEWVDDERVNQVVQDLSQIGVTDAIGLGVKLSELHWVSNATIGATAEYSSERDYKVGELIKRTATVNGVASYWLYRANTNMTAGAWNAAKWDRLTEGPFAQYMVKLDTGGKVAGFGLTNDGVTSIFEVRSDKFAIYPEDNTDGNGFKPSDFDAGTHYTPGRRVRWTDGYNYKNIQETGINAPGTPPVAPPNASYWVKYTDLVPFITDVDWGVVMDGAFIKDATITNAKIGSLSADKITGGTITATVSMSAATITGGSLTIGNNKFNVNSSGDVTIKNGTSGARMEIKNNVIKVWDSNNVVRVRLGDLSA